jgi:hypothetical protein
LETTVTERSWKPIKAAPKGIGPLLLRVGGGPLDPAFVGYQADDGRWFSGDAEVRPAYYFEIPNFDADEAAS